MKRLQAIVAIITLHSLAFCAVSCTVHPIVTESAGKVTVSMGGSILTSTVSEIAQVTTRDGTTVTYSITGKDETAVPKTLIISRGGVALAKAAGAAKNSAVLPAIGGAAVGIGGTILTTPKAKTTPP